jgi:nitrate reductase NapE component
MINVNRNAKLQRKWMEIATFLLIAAGQFCLLSFGCQWVFGYFLVPFPYPLRITQRLSSSI